MMRKAADARQAWRIAPESEIVSASNGSDNATIYQFKDAVMLLLVMS
jgi:hypothetical protein